MSFRDVTASWTKNRRKTIGRRRREFAARGGELVWLDQPALVARALPHVFELHRVRRHSLGLPTGFGTTPNSRAFHERLAETDDETSGTWIQLARVGDEIVGALYGFRLGSTYSVYQSGWDPAWQDSSLGLVQYAAAFEHVVEHEGTCFDMCRGADAYKLRFATETKVEHSYIAPRTIAGHALRARLRLSSWRRERSAPPSTAAEDAP
jgi:CelD/BcsL family acetyltransferase involved in cellulose biosynthesis